MSYEMVVQLVRQSVLVAFYLSAPILTVALAVGLTVSVVQTVTQIQEQTVAFVLKLFASGFILLAILPWMLSLSVGFATQVVRAVPTMVY
ncbi:MAG: flagellar biosynthetic protein FliQ [Longimicrobiales bacterium]